MITRRLFSLTLAASTAAAGAQVALPQGSARLLDASVVSTSTSSLDHLPFPGQASAANRLAGRAALQAAQPFVPVI